MKRRHCTYLALVATTCFAGDPVLQTLTIPIGSQGKGGRLVVEFSTMTDFAHAYNVLGPASSDPGKVIEFDEGDPADLTLQLDESGKTVLCLKFGGFYMSNHFAFIKKPDGTVVTNTPQVVFNGATQSVLAVWQSLGKTNKSFRLERLKTGDDPTSPSTRTQ